MSQSELGFPRTVEEAPAVYGHMGRRRQIRSGMGSRLCTEDVDRDRLTDMFSELVSHPGNSDICSCIRATVRSSALNSRCLFSAAAHRSGNIMRSC